MGYLAHPVTEYRGQTRGIPACGKSRKENMTNAFQFHSANEASAVIGPQDIWAKRIEEAFSVTLHLRGDSVDFTGDETGKAMALSVLKAAVQLHEQGEEIREGLMDRLIEEAKEGALDSLFHAMDSAVTMNYKGLPIRCKTFGQQNYVKMLQEKTVTICIGPAGTGKTYLAVAQAAQELKDGTIYASSCRDLPSKPARNASAFCPAILPRRWILT